MTEDAAAANPYATPMEVEAKRRKRGAAGYSRIGDCLVMTTGTRLPRRCIHCGEDVDGSGKTETKTIHYCSRLVYLLLLVNLLVLIVVYYLIRKPLNLTYSTCATHVAIRRRRSLIAVTLLLATLGFLFGAIAMPVLGAVGVCTLAALLVYALYLVVVNRSLSIRKHEHGQFHVTGFAPAFLDAIPQEGGR